jgi:hypothetical protein
VVDWPAAKAALDALIEAEADQWVEWEANGQKYRARGTEIQWWSGLWRSDGNGVLTSAYRKGRELERAKCAKLREAVLGADGVIGEGVNSWGNTIEGPHWDRIVALAKGGE